MNTSNLFRFSVVASAIILGACGVEAAHESADATQVGYARVDVTPPIGTPLSGYYSRRVSNGVLDPLHATCVAFSDGTEKVLVFVLDQLHAGEKVIASWKAAITAATGIPAGHQFIACTHIHTGPAISSDAISVSMAKQDVPIVKEAIDLTRVRLRDAALLALADLAPAKFSYARGEAKGISFIRRFKMKDGSTATNPGTNNPNIDHAIGSPDEQVQLVRIDRAGKKSIAFINFQCHPDVIGGNKISADWPGLACRYLEKAFDGEIEAVLMNGAQGDTNHLRVHVKPGEVVPQRYEMSKHMARTIAGAVMSIWDECRPIAGGRVQGATALVKIDTNRGKPEELALAHKYVEAHKAGRVNEIPGTGMWRTTETARAYRICELEKGPDYFEIPISTITIGSTLCFAGFAGEPFTAMGTEIKAKSPFTVTFPACCCDGSRGYFPVKSAYAEGGYEAATSRFAPGTAERLVDAQLKAINGFYSSSKK